MNIHTLILTPSDVKGSLTRTSSIFNLQLDGLVSKSAIRGLATNVHHGNEHFTFQFSNILLHKKPRALFICQNWLAGSASLQIECVGSDKLKVALEQTGHPSRARSVWPENSSQFCSIDAFHLQTVH